MRMMAPDARMRTQPLPMQRTVRPSTHRVLTSFKPGLMVPVACIPLLREDSVVSAMFRLSFEMKETVELLMNNVNARALTYFVPRTAFDRFDGMDAINKSYAGLPLVEGGDVTPWFETMAAPAHGANAILKALGKHARPGSTINTDYIEAYNQIWNFRARNRSPDIDLRDRLDATLAPAFWQHQTFAHIVPDFDQLLIDGAVPLSIGNARLPVKGLGIAGSGTAGNFNVAESDGATVAYTPGWGVTNVADVSGGAGTTRLYVRKHPELSGDIPDVFAELEDNGITLSLANLEMAKKTAAFARLRTQFTGHDDEYIIDMLMSGLSIPEQAWKQPILLGDTNTVFGMSKRYATDGSSLTESVVNGMTMLEQRFRLPPAPMGGVVMMVVEVTPDQLFERQKDPYLYSVSVDTLPDALRDDLDPEKVSIVKNEDIDLDHSAPNDTFGYAPLNHEWTRSIPAIGGKFYRPEVDASFDEDRQRIWAVETADPVLSQDFYLCTTMHQKPFVETTGDNFELLMRGEAAIRGLTVFGPQLIESTDDYEKVEAKQPRERIDKDAVAE